MSKKDDSKIPISPDAYNYPPTPEFDSSEPEFLIGVMDRHEGYAVIVCLIGGGQEINTGEAGLPEFFWL